MIPVQAVTVILWFPAVTLVSVLLMALIFIWNNPYLVVILMLFFLNRTWTAFAQLPLHIEQMDDMKYVKEQQYFLYLSIPSEFFINFLWVIVMLCLGYWKWVFNI